MKLFSTEHKFKYPWDKVSTANWLKYPNENTPHVTNVDYLWRRVDERTGCLHTARLITCKQSGPAFFASFLSGADGAAMAYEESIVDPRNKTLTVRSKNLTLANLISVEETCFYSPSTATNTETSFKQEAQISVTGWMHFKDYIEDFCVNRFQSNASKGRLALDEVLDRVYEETCEQITDLIRDVTGIPFQHPEEKKEDLVSSQSTTAIETTLGVPRQMGGGTTGPSASNGSTDSKSWRTDREISDVKGRQGGPRELARWDGGASGAAPISDDFEKEARLGTGWDQFEVNRKLFGVTTSFDESIYTTPLNMSAPDFREKEMQAARLAKEILTSQAGNVHLAEERGQCLGADYDDEEERYGAVLRGPEGNADPKVQLPPQRSPRFGVPRKSITNLHADAESLEAAKTVVDQAAAKVTRRLSQINEDDLNNVLSEEGRPRLPSLGTAAKKGLNPNAAEFVPSTPSTTRPAPPSDYYNGYVPGYTYYAPAPQMGYYPGAGIDPYLQQQQQHAAYYPQPGIYYPPEAYYYNAGYPPNAGPAQYNPDPSAPHQPPLQDREQ